MEKHIFVSHSTFDDHVVAKLRKEFEIHGRRPWVDSRQLTAGEDLRERI